MKYERNVNGVEELVKMILAFLDKAKYDDIDRIKIVKDIYNIYGEYINDFYSYYLMSNLKIYNNNKCMKLLNNMLNEIDNYILFSNSPISNKHKFYKNDNLKNSIGTNGTISLEDLSKKMLISEDDNTKKYYNDFNHAKYTLKSLIDHLNKCPYTKDYINFNNNVRKIIESGETNNTKIINDERKNIYHRVINRQKIKHEMVNGVLKPTPVESKVVTNDVIKFTDQEIKKLVRMIGYTKNNSIEIDKDLIAILREYFRFIYFTSPLKESEEIDWEQFDFTDILHVMALLKIQKGESFDSNLGCLIYDLNRLIEKCKLTKNEEEILELYRDHDLDSKDIASELGYTKGYIIQVINKISNRIINKYWEQLDDWYNLNIIKGSYKTCSKCGEIKLIKFFSPKADSKDGFHPYCKSCR